MYVTKFYFIFFWFLQTDFPEKITYMVVSPKNQEKRNHFGKLEEAKDQNP